MNLTATNDNEKAILAFVLANATPELMERIEAEGKTMQGCWKYLTSYAKAKIAKRDRHGEVCVYVSPEEIFGQAMHYFEDEAEGTIYKSEEDLKEEAEARIAAEEREAKRKADEEEARRKEEERIAAMTPEEREAEEARKAQEKAERIIAEEEAHKREIERKIAEQKKREEAEARRKAAEEKRRAKERREEIERNQPTLFDFL